VAQEAYRIDPLSDDIHGVVGAMLLYTRQYPEAIAHFQSRSGTRSLRTLVGLGRACAAARRFPEAIEALRTAVAESNRDPSVEAELGRIYAEAGQAGHARRILEDLEARRRSATGYVAPQDLAYIHVALKENDLALALLDEAVDEHASRLLWLSVDPRVDALRDDPRFVSLMGRLHNIR
jgi:Flp pilus assembly protein TadD